MRQVLAPQPSHWLSFCLAYPQVLSPFREPSLGQRPSAEGDHSGANVSKEGPAAGNRNDVKTMQQILRDKGHYRGEVDGVSGLRTWASIRGFQKADNLQSQGSLIRRRPLNSESDPRVARRVAARQRKVNLLQA